MKLLSIIVPCIRKNVNPLSEILLSTPLFDRPRTFRCAAVVSNNTVHLSWYIIQIIQLCVCVSPYNFYNPKNLSAYYWILNRNPRLKLLKKIYYILYIHNSYLMAYDGFCYNHISFSLTTSLYKNWKIYIFIYYIFFYVTLNNYYEKFMIIVRVICLQKFLQSKEKEAFCISWIY